MPSGSLLGDRFVFANDRISKCCPSSFNWYLFLLRYLDRFPRTSIFLMSLMFFCRSSWLLATTYELATQGKALLFARNPRVISQSEKPALYMVSLCGQVILGGLTFIDSLAAVVAAFFRKRGKERPGNRFEH